MGATGYDYKPEKTIFENFCEGEGLDPKHVEIWRLKDRDIHFAMRASDGELFTAIAYTWLSNDSEDRDKCLFWVKVVDMSMGFVEPLHPHVQKYYDDHIHSTFP